MAEQYFKRKLASLRWRLLKAEKLHLLAPELMRFAHETLLAWYAWIPPKGLDSPAQVQALKDADV